jgi:hypothetical protein
MNTLTVILPDGLVPKITQTPGSVVISYAPPPTPVPPTSKRFFGYFGSQGTQFEETKDHVNLHFAPGWGEEDLFGQQVAACKAAGISVMLFAYTTFDGSHWSLSQMTRLLEAAKAANALDAIVAVYPVDEPDFAGISDQVMTDCCAAIRALLRGYYPDPASAPKIACFYGTTGNVPGLPSVDWVGRDWYGHGPQDLGSASQRLMLISGGADGVDRDAIPPFVDRFNTDPRVVAFMSFIWIDNWGFTGNRGIRSNGMAAQYRATGHALTGKAQ